MGCLVGADHTVGLTRGETLLSWGSGQLGALGRISEQLASRGLKELLLQPLPIPFAKGKHGEEVVDFACEAYNTFVLRKTGDTEKTVAYFFGLNNDGQRGVTSKVRFWLGGVSCAVKGTNQELRWSDSI